MKKLIIPLSLCAGLIAVPTVMKGLQRALEEAQKTREAQLMAVEKFEPTKKTEEIEEVVLSPKLLQKQNARQLKLNMMINRTLALITGIGVAFEEFKARAAAQSWIESGLFLGEAATLIALYATLEKGIDQVTKKAADKRKKHWWIAKPKRRTLDAEADKLDEKGLELEAMKMRLEEAFPQLKGITLP